MSRFGRTIGAFAVAVALLGLGGLAMARDAAQSPVTKFQKLQSGFYVLGTGSLAFNLGSASTATNNVTAVVKGASVTFPVTDADISVAQTSSVPIPVHISKDVTLDDKRNGHVDATVSIEHQGTLGDTYVGSAAWIITDSSGTKIGEVDAPSRTLQWKP